jgi:Tfp pilus assembly protein PilN
MHGRHRVGTTGRLRRNPQQQAMRVSAPGLLDVSDRIAVSVQDTSMPQAHKDCASDEPSNPLYVLGAITLGIPALLLIPLVGTNPGIQEGTLAALTKLLVLSGFLVAAIFEIKRLADQPSEADPHQ